MSTQPSIARRLLISLLLALGTWLAASCQAAQPTPTPFPPRPPAGSTVPAGALATRSFVHRIDGTPGRSLNLKGRFAFVANDGNLTIQDANSGATRVLVPTSSDGYAQSPAISPDGTQVAFSYNIFTPDGFVKSQVRVINADGSGERTIAAPEDLRITLDLPAWSPDGKDIYVTQMHPILPSDQHVEIDRLSAIGGELKLVIDGGYEAHLSPDGKKMTYQRIDFNTFTAGLWVANSDGSDAHQILQNGAFAAIFGARFSPDGQTILFAASGPPRLKLPGLQGYINDEHAPIAHLDGCYFSVLSFCLVKTASAHGLPWDLWLVDKEGTKYERLTEIGADSPVPVWSDDGKFIAFFEAAGIYLLDRDKKAIYQLSSDGGYGGFDWR